MLLFLWRERLYPSPMPPPLQPTLSAEVVPRFSLASHKVRSKLVRPTVPHDTHHTLGSLPPEKRCFWGQVPAYEQLPSLTSFPATHVPRYHSQVSAVGLVSLGSSLRMAQRELPQRRSAQMCDGAARLSAMRAWQHISVRTHKLLRTAK